MIKKQVSEKQISEVMSSLGKKGSAKRWKSRYEILVELSAIYGKDRQDEFMKKWPTKALTQLLDWHKRHSKNNKK